MVAVLNSYFSKASPINSVSTWSNLFKNFIFVHFLLLEDYEQVGLRKDLNIAPLMEWFRTATLRKSH